MIDASELRLVGGDGKLVPAPTTPPEAPAQPLSAMRGLAQVAVASGVIYGLELSAGPKLWRSNDGLVWEPAGALPSDKVTALAATPARNAP